LTSIFELFSVDSAVCLQHALYNKHSYSWYHTAGEMAVGTTDIGVSGNLAQAAT